jgi:hypothetical protein
MRRVTGLAIGFCAVVAMTGVATASVDPLGIIAPVPVGGAVPAVAPAGAPRDPAPAQRPPDRGGVAQAVPTVGAPVAGRPAGTAGRQRIGTIEQVTSVLDYVGGSRSRTFRYPGASYVKLHFDRMSLLPGDRLSITDGAGREVHSYTGSPGELRDGWAMSVTGDTAEMTLHSAKADPLGLRARLAHLGIGVDRVARGDTVDERKARRAAATAEARRTPGGESGREESLCGPSDERADAACYRSTNPTVYAHSKPVARILINGVELCTAWRVGPNNRMFTNHHCFDSDASARNTEVWFNYECAQCGGFAVLPVTKVWGHDVLATDYVLDYTLFSVYDFAAVQRFGYLELDPRQPRRGEDLYIPQHPGGEPTQISLDERGRGSDCAVVDGAYNGYGYGTDVSYYCDTMGGSSGSPVLTRDGHRVVALHHFGGCPNSGVRMDLIYHEVAGLL